MDNKQAKQGFTPQIYRPSSFRPCGRLSVRDIGADKSGIISRITKLRDDGLFYRGFTPALVTPQGFYAGYSAGKQQGFTLIELLVVVLIIGILAAVALPQYQKAVEKARATELITKMSNIAKGIDLWLLSNPMSNQRFVGCPDTTDHKCNVLDIDVEHDLICDQDGGTACRSKYATYRARCNPDLCTIDVFRVKDGDWDQYGWDVWMYWDLRDGKWDKFCGYCTEESPYKSFCKSLESQGWSAGDEC